MIYPNQPARILCHIASACNTAGHWVTADGVLADRIVAEAAVTDRLDVRGYVDIYRDYQGDACMVEPTPRGFTAARRIRARVS